MHRSAQSQVVEGCWDDGAGVRAEDDHAGVLARDLPETALHAASRRLTTRPSAAPYTRSVAWVGEALHRDVNHPHINGMQGVRGSNPLSSTRHTLSAGHLERFPLCVEDALAVSGNSSLDVFLGRRSPPGAPRTLRGRPSGPKGCSASRCATAPAGCPRPRRPLRPLGPGTAGRPRPAPPCARPVNPGGGGRGRAPGTRSSGARLASRHTTVRHPTPTIGYRQWPVGLVMIAMGSRTQWRPLCLNS
jgi:hypothetical protein